MSAFPNKFHYKPVLIYGTSKKDKALYIFKQDMKVEGYTVEYDFDNDEAIVITPEGGMIYSIKEIIEKGGRP